MKKVDKYKCIRTINNLFGWPLFVEGKEYKVIDIEKLESGETYVALDHILYGNEYHSYDLSFVEENFVKMDNRELRMYFLVMDNLSSIQQGKQAGHCAEEYAEKYGQTDLYKEYRKFKTWIILNGGVSNDGHNGGELGSMEKYQQFLIDNNVPYAFFRESDLNNSLSALCFICDNRVYDWENYPTFQKWFGENSNDDLSLEDGIYGWSEFVGGKINVSLKELISGKRLV
jgi:hypothetical protein